MKNISLSILVAVSLALVSCGTGTYSANGNGGYTNSIYYTSSDAVPTSSGETYTQANTQDVKQLQTKTVAVLNSNTGKVFAPAQPAYADTIFVGDENIVNVELNPESSYVIVDDEDSYEARLRKFDNATYVINVIWDPMELSWYNPFRWSWDYPYYRYRYGYHSAIYWNDWYNWRWGWNDPWGYGWSWYDRWYSPYWSWTWYWGWGSRWHDPWYYAGYYHPYHHPHHGYRPGWNHDYHHSTPGRYYTRRGGRNDRGGVNRTPGVTPRSTATASRAVGSSYRRTPTVGNVRTAAVSRGNSTRGNAAVGRNASSSRNAVVNRNSSGNRNATVSRSTSTGRNAVVSRSGNVSRSTTPGGVRYGNATGTRNTAADYRTTPSNRGTVVSRSSGNGGTVYRKSTGSSGRNP